MSAIDTFIDRNAEYAARFGAPGLEAAPARRVAVVTCMDARVDPRTALGLADGDAHVIRNAGGAVTDDVIRSLTISQRILGTREVMLIQHTRCGMAAFTEDELRERIGKETGIRPPFALETFAELEANLRQSLARIHASPFVAHKDAVRGFVYDVDTGRLREVERG